ncbi:MAG: hypothetical protein E7F44_17520 [Morganella morganii]|nr:hypothetical protein [Morganella morganii]MDU3450409.1 hypothetical protein [Morganella morganii]MDU3507268.1 hypothetical protein [Morganella morganii]
MIYTDGTIAIKAGSPIVTGTGTQWKKNIHGVAPGQLISIENGTAPVSMMIRAVNSDTELVLSFNAPVTLSGAKYSIATTVPDTISDAARTMSANQGYIVYFLQAMQQWMTDTGQVEIELPNGQKVTLDSIKALNDAISKIPKVVQGTGDSKTDVISQDGTVKAINAAKPGDATTATKGIVQLTGTVGESMVNVMHQKAVKDWIAYYLFGQTDNSVVNGLYAPDKKSWIGIKNGGIFYCNTTDTQLFSFQDGRLKLYNTMDCVSRAEIASPNNNFKAGLYAYDDGRLLLSALRTGDGGWSNITIPKKGGEMMSTGNYYVDGSGYVKKSSPIIQIRPDGNYETNDESAGAEVRRTGTGQYHITGILGYNSDGAWGVNGGISVPKDNNGLELVYVADRVLEDGSIIIETCHRQHAHLPERFQNWRLKEITPEGERIFYQDGEPCDLPESTRLDVRVEMPQGSVWNIKQRELAEQMEREQAEREAQEAAEQAGSTEE